MYPPSTSCGEIGLILHKILYSIIGYTSMGQFVEVGAHDGKTGSFTYQLAVMGWRGVYVEPMSQQFYECMLNHSRHPLVKCYNVAAGESVSELEMCSAGTLSTADPITLEVYKKADWAREHITNRIMNVRVRPLDDILDDAKVSNIDLMVIDVEGYELNVLRGFDIERFKPSVIIIEIADLHPSFQDNAECMGKFKEIRNYLTDAGYTLMVNDIVDNVYVYNPMYRADKAEEYRSLIKFKQYTNDLIHS